MIIKDLNIQFENHNDQKLSNAVNLFNQLLEELRKKELPDELISSLNQGIDELNTFSDRGKALRKEIHRQQSVILARLEKELKIVPKKHYQNTWMALGISTFGIPLGVALGISLDNMAFIGIGLPIGLTIGLAIGAGMDKKALEEGRQLDIEIN